MSVATSAFAASPSCNLKLNYPKQMKATGGNLTPVIAIHEFVARLRSLVKDMFRPYADSADRLLSGSDFQS